MVFGIRLANPLLIMDSFFMFARSLLGRHKAAIEVYEEALKYSGKDWVNEKR